MLGDNISAQGSDNIVAGRDVNYVVDRDSLRAIFSDRIRAVDESINALLPEGGMISPTAENMLQEFKCEQLVISLTKVGIPMRVGIDIAEGVGRHFSAIIQGANKITTRHVREAVLQSIYSLKGRYAEPAICRWADEYARRYGNPDERIKILLITHKAPRPPLTTGDEFKNLLSGTSKNRYFREASLNMKKPPRGGVTRIFECINNQIIM